MVRALKSHRSMTITFVGDPGSGKSSLLARIVLESFPLKPAKVLPKITVPGAATPELIHTQLVDTSSKVSDWGITGQEILQSDVVVVVWDTSIPEQFERVGSFWLVEIRRFQEARKGHRHLPVILCGTKIDLRGANTENPKLFEQIRNLTERFPEIETGMECSAKTGLNVPQLFFFAQRAVLFPTAPLFDPIFQKLKPEAAVAFGRIFSLLDEDGDGFLGDHEIVEFQHVCFGIPLYEAEVSEVKNVIQKYFPEGADERGISLTGFLFIIRLFITKGKLESPWTILRKYKYTNDLQLEKDFLYPPFDYQPGLQRVEFTDVTEDFLRGVFRRYMTKGTEDDTMTPRDLEKLFLTLTPEIPWKLPLLGVETNKKHNLTLEGWLCQWRLQVIDDPRTTLKYLAYLGHTGKPDLALVAKPVRAPLHRKTVYQILVLGDQELTDPILKMAINRELEDLRPIAKSVCHTLYPEGFPKTIVLSAAPITQKISPSHLTDSDIVCFAYDAESPDGFGKIADVCSDMYPILESSQTHTVQLPCFFNSGAPVRQNYRLQPAEFLEMFPKITQKFYVHGATKNSIFEEILSKLDIEIPTHYRFFRSWVRIWPMRFIVSNPSGIYWSLVHLAFGTTILHYLDYSSLGWPLWAPMFVLDRVINFFGSFARMFTGIFAHFVLSPFAYLPHYPGYVMQDLANWSTGWGKPIYPEGTDLDYFDKPLGMSILDQNPEFLAMQHVEDAVGSQMPTSFYLSPEDELQMAHYPLSRDVGIGPGEYSGKAMMNPTLYEAHNAVALDAFGQDPRIFGQPLDNEQVEFDRMWQTFESASVGPWRQGELNDFNSTDWGNNQRDPDNAPYTTYTP